MPKENPYSRDTYFHLLKSHAHKKKERKGKKRKKKEKEIKKRKRKGSFQVFRFHHLKCTFN